MRPRVISVIADQLRRPLLHLNCQRMVIRINIADNLRSRPKRRVRRVEDITSGRRPRLRPVRIDLRGERTPARQRSAVPIRATNHVVEVIGVLRVRVQIDVKVVRQLPAKCSDIAHRKHRVEAQILLHS